MSWPARIVADDRVRLWRDGSVLLGGAPWAVLRIAPAGRDFVRRLRDAGAAGLEPRAGVEESLAALLVARGVAHPVPVRLPASGVEVVVPVLDDPDRLEACLTALRVASPGVRVVVVDDGSATPAVGDVARAHGAVLLRHDVNRGPAAARNTGRAAVTAPVVAFVDADVEVSPGWLETLLGHFDDPRVAAVAPRVAACPDCAKPPLLQRFQAVRSSLDMGRRPQLVCPGAPLGYLPSAALLVRRDDAQAHPFDETLRLGEDVDLIWRLVDAGRAVRYEPAAVVHHRMRPTARAWLRRIADYGFSAGELERRHPGRLTPARLSRWNVAAAAAALAPVGRRPARAVPAVAIVTAATVLLGRRLRATSVDAGVAPVVVGKGLAANAAATGHLLRREWWPLGWAALACAPWSAVARAAAAAMVVPLVGEWLDRRPMLDPLRYLGLRLLEDAAYGSGVIVAAVRSRQAAVLLPTIR